MESVEGKMTELTEQMLACWMSAWRITTLAPKGHRVRWLSRFHCRSLALPRGMVLSQSAGWAAVRAGRMWPKYGQRGEPQNMESWKPSSFALLDTWPHPVTDCKSCTEESLHDTRLHYGLLLWNTTGPAEPELLRFFLGLFLLALGARASSPFCDKDKDKVSLRPG